MEKTLSFTGSRLTEPPELPESLRELYCNNNQLTEFSKLPESLIELGCGNNKLTRLPELPGSLKELQCYDGIIIDDDLIKNLSKFNRIEVFIINNYRIEFTDRTIKFISNDHSFEVEKIY